MADKNIVDVQGLYDFAVEQGLKKQAQKILSDHLIKVGRNGKCEETSANASSSRAYMALRRLVDGLDETFNKSNKLTLNEDLFKESNEVEFTRGNIVKVLRNELGYEPAVTSPTNRAHFRSGDYTLEFDRRNNNASIYPRKKSDTEFDRMADVLKVFKKKLYLSPEKTSITIFGNIKP